MKPLSAIDVLAVVARLTGYAVPDLQTPTSRNAEPDRSRARQAAALLMAEELELPQTQIARALGLVNHTTIVSALARAKRNMALVPGYADLIAQAREELVRLAASRRRPARRSVAPGAAVAGLCSIRRGPVRAA